MNLDVEIVHQLFPKATIEANEHVSDWRVFLFDANRNLLIFTDPEELMTFAPTNEKVLRVRRILVSPRIYGLLTATTD